MRFSDVEEAGPLLRSVLPDDVVARIDWSTLRCVSGGFVDAELAERKADLLFEVDSVDGKVLIRLLVEHQSAVDALMPFRVYGYLGRSWEEWLREHGLGEGLPPVIPVVVYAGEQPWTKPTEMSELVLGPDGPWKPKLDFYLVDLSGASEADIDARSLELFGRLTLRALVRLPRSAEPVAVLLGWVELLAELLSLRNGRERIVALFAYMGRIAAIERADVQTVLRRLGSVAEDEVMKSFAERMFANVEEAFEVIADTSARAAEERMLKAVVLEQLEARFGELSEGDRARVEAGLTDDLRRWARRLLFAREPGEVFSSVSLE